MIAKLYWSECPDGVIFSCLVDSRALPFEGWASASPVLTSGKPASVGHLLLLVESEDASLTEDGRQVLVPHTSLAQLERWQTDGLGLPSPAPFQVLLNTQGLLATPNFIVRYGFRRPGGMPVLGVQRHGALITEGSKQHLLSDPLFSLAEMLDAYQAAPIKDLDERFLWWAKVQEHLPQDAEISSFLRTIHIVKPDAFTLEINTKNGLTEILPRFIQSGGGPDLEPDEALPEVPAGEFHNRFLQQSQPGKKYALSGNWYVVLPPAIRTGLAVVREINDADEARKRAFLANPRAALRKAFEAEFGQEFDEAALESVFTETPRFLSQRIIELGVWQPKAGIFIKTGGGQWLPDEEPPQEVGLLLDGEIRSVPSGKLSVLRKAIEEAQIAGDSSVEFEGVRYPVSEISIAAVKRAESFFIKESGPGSDGNKERKQSTPPQDVPIIYDHIQKLGIELGLTPRSFDPTPPRLNPGITLHEHQEKGLSWLQDHWKAGTRGALLADDMGLGKTLQTLSFFAWLRQQMVKGYSPKRPILVVAPTALLTNWEEEASKFLPSSTLGECLRAHGSHFSELFLRGPASAARRLKESGWVLTTYETLRDKIQAFIPVQWAVAAFDEAQKIKNPKAMLTDMAKSIAADFTLTLTGTPVENSLADLWCIVDTAQPGCLNSLKEFAATYIPSGQSGEVELVRLKKELEQPAGFPVMLRRAKDEHWKERPTKHENIIHEVMPAPQAEVYSLAVAAARSGESSKGSMLEALQKLRAVSLHPCPHEDTGDTEAYIGASARLRALFKTLDNIHNIKEKVLIFVEYLQMQAVLAQIIQSRYACRNIMLINGGVSGSKRQERVRQFQDGPNGFDAIILSPKAGGVGLNLTAATHVVHLSRWWNPAMEDQCSDRAYRIGQLKPVTIHYPLAIHPEYGESSSFDMKLHELLERKRYLSRTLLAPPAENSGDIKDLFGQTIKSA